MKYENMTRETLKAIEGYINEDNVHFVKAVAETFNSLLEHSKQVDDELKKFNSEVHEINANIRYIGDSLKWLTLNTVKINNLNQWEKK